MAESPDAMEKDQWVVEVPTVETLSGFYDVTLRVGKLRVEEQAKLALGLTMFCQAHLANPDLHTQLAHHTLKNAEKLQHGYLQLCEGLLGMMQDVSTCAEEPELSTYRPLWEAMDSTLHELLETLQGLLTVPNFVAVVQELLKGEDGRLQRSALAMFNRKLEEVGSATGSRRASNQEMALFLEMLPDLQGAIQNATDDGIKDAEHASRVQTAILSVDILARAFANRSPTSFIAILSQVANFVSRIQDDQCTESLDSPLEAVVSTGFLLLATLCALVGARALPHLKTFLPPMLLAIETQTSRVEGNLVRTAALSALSAVSAHLPQFLHPYLPRLLPALLIPQKNDPHPDEQEGRQRTAHTTIASAGVQPRLLLPALFKVYKDIVANGAQTVCRTFEFLSMMLSAMDRMAVVAHLDSLSQFFLLGLEYHAENHGEIQIELLRQTDVIIAKSAVEMVLKLNEDELKGFFLQCSEWRKLDSQESSIHLTCKGVAFFSLVDTLADRLKSIFTPFFGYIWNDMVEDLQPTKSQEITSEKKKKKSKSGSKRKFQSLEELSEEDKITQYLLKKCIVSALQKLFQHDREGFLDKKRFNLVMAPLVDQLDEVDVPGGESEYKNYIENSVAPALAQLADCVKQDALWKPMNHRILMKMRDENSAIRLASLKTLEQCFMTVGEEYLILLPECLSYLSELLEDNEPEVESHCRKLLKYLEDLSGENIESYLS
eukprot:CAMPEP_0117748010 /NCGR_PEP_ID=MMETSP0947-20121206/8831_1 /TAXON_ID=44440 /ORGANISM="Chattonella subsalsa, Strain CCMP2191" /LENGTH=718 /DNA_ID=CAMNT_0005565531 /DNA_START=250 /DNA_END=2410 /DNA_ORIENTATION=-